MGIWQTNKSSMKINISQSLIGKYKSEGCKFCWYKDNPILDKEECEVTTIDNEKVTGYIAFSVNGTSYGSDPSCWFLICPSKKAVDSDKTR